MSNSHSGAYIHRRSFGPNRRLRHATILLRLWIVIVVAVVVGSLLPQSFLNGLGAGQAVSSNDKLTHAASYFVLAFLPILGLGVGGLGLLCASAMAPLGALLEFAQLWVPARSCEAADIAADVAGVLAGMVVASAIRTKVLRKEI